MKAKDANDVYRETGELPDPFERSHGSDIVTHKQGLKGGIKKIHERVSRGKSLAGIASGYEELDQAIDGWQRGKFYVVGGRSGMGKSVFALNLTLRFADQGHAGDYITLEMSVEEQVQRAMFCWGNVESHRVKDGTLRQSDIGKLYQATSEMSKWDLVWNPKSSLTVEDVRDHIKRVKAYFSEDGKTLYWVVVDHLLLLKGSNQKQPRREQLLHITQQLKAIAKDEDVCMIALTQLNRALEARGVKDRRPQISDLKESGSTEEDADVIILLHRADKFEKDKTKWTGMLDVLIPKIRGGEDCFMKLKFDGSRQRIDQPDWVH